MQSILGNTRKKDITFRRDGQINISARVASALGLENGDVIDVLRDRMEYYLYVKIKAPTVGKHEASCFRSKKNCNFFRAWSKKLCSAMIEASGVSDPNLKKIDLIVGEPTSLEHIGSVVPIIYKHVLNHD